jgi:hypothetical protein
MINLQDILPITYCNSVDTLQLTQDCCLKALEQGIPGDFAEAGVANGGHCIVMNSLGRRTWLFDSFEGISKYGEEDVEFTQSWGKTNGAKNESSGITVHSLENVKATLQRFGPLDNYKFVKGWFCDTLPMFKETTFSVLRLDCDIYHAYVDCLKYLYPLLNKGGWLIIDDYHLTGCKQALDEAGLTGFQFVNGIAYLQK